jgi:proteasome accessory factor C
VFEPRPGDAIVDIEVARGAAWVADRYPNLGVRRTRGKRLRIRLPVSEPAWLERLLVILGPDGRVVEVVEGPEALAGAGRAAADRILDRYADPST